MLIDISIKKLLQIFINLVECDCFNRSYGSSVLATTSIRGYCPTASLSVDFISSRTFDTVQTTTCERFKALA